jgi:hypothetical protein
MAQPDLSPNNINAVLGSCLDPDSKLVLLRSMVEPTGVTIDALSALRLGDLRISVAVGKLVRDGLVKRSTDMTSVIFAGVPAITAEEREWTTQEHFDRFSAATRQFFASPSHETVRAFGMVLSAIKKNLRDRYLERYSVTPPVSVLDAMTENYISSTLRGISSQPGMGTRPPSVGVLRQKASLDRWVNMNADNFRQQETGVGARTNADARKSLGLT